MTDELKPCPFCNGTDCYVERTDHTACTVICDDCTSHGPESCPETNEDTKIEDERDLHPGQLAAIRGWNRRLVTHQKELFDWLEFEMYDLRCESVATGGDDYDVVWKVYSHHGNYPHLRLEGHGGTVLEAIQNAKNKAGGA